jgi:hypothetical protein
MKREELEQIINDPTISQIVKDDAIEQLKKLDTIEQSESLKVDSEISFAIKEFNNSIEKLSKQGVDKEQVREIVEEKIQDTKFLDFNKASTDLKVASRSVEGVSSNVCTFLYKTALRKVARLGVSA